MSRKKVNFCKLSALMLSLCLLVTLFAGCTTTSGVSTGTTEKTATTSTGTTTTTSTSTSTTATNTEPAGVAKPAVLEITRENYFGDASDYPDMKAEFMVEFEKKFGVKLKVNFYPKNEYMTKVNLAITAGEIQGVANIYGPAANVMKARDDGTILPIEDYLKDNENWIKWEADYKTLKENYKFTDGKTWALPMGFAYNFFVSVKSDVSFFKKHLPLQYI